MTLSRWKQLQQFLPNNYFPIHFYNYSTALRAISMAEKTMKAIRMKSQGEAAIDNVPIPDLRDGYILVKTKAVAINPADWKFIDFLASPGETLGFDYSGVVVQVGANVEKGFRPGDRVAGMVHGYNALNHQDGAFAEYTTARADLQMKIPSEMTFEAAVTLGSGLLTVGQSLYQSLGLPLPKSVVIDNFVLIYGGSTATGSLAIQFAKLSGLRVVATCSPRHESWLRDLGADHVFDYKSPTCAADIRKITDDKVVYALDPIATTDTAQICCDAIGSQGGTYTALQPISKLPRSDVVNQTMNVLTSFGEAFSVGGNDIPLIPADYEFASKFIKLAEGLLSEHEIRVHPVSLQPGGLEGVLDGVNKMREGKVSGVKLVYTIGSSE